MPSIFCDLKQNLKTECCWWWITLKWTCSTFQMNAFILKNHFGLKNVFQYIFPDLYCTSANVSKNKACFTKKEPKVYSNLKLCICHFNNKKSIYPICPSSVIKSSSCRNYIFNEKLLLSKVRCLTAFFSPYDRQIISIVLQPSPFFPNLYLIFQFIIKNGTNKKSVWELVKR